MLVILTIYLSTVGIETDRFNDEIKKSNTNIKTTFFQRRSGDKVLKFIQQVKCDILAVDEKYPKKLKEEAKKRDIILQGNLNPEILLIGGPKMEKKIKDILFDFRNNKHIFNLSHGVLPKTPVQNVTKTIDTVRNYESRKSTS